MLFWLVRVAGLVLFAAGAAAQTAPSGILKQSINRSGPAWQEGVQDGTGHVIPQFNCVAGTGGGCTIVPNALSGVGVLKSGDTMTGALTISPPSGLGLGQVVSQTIHGSQASNVSSNYWGATDDATITNTGGFLIPWNFNHNFGGANLAGNRTSLNLQSVFTAPDNNTTVNPNFIAFTPIMNVTSGDHGTTDIFAGGARGAFFVENLIATASGALHLQALTPQENDVSCSSTCSVAYLAGLTIAELSTGVTQGAQTDAGLVISAAPGAVGFKTPIEIGADNGALPYNASSTIVRTGGGTAAYGIDLRATSFVSAALASPGFIVDGFGDVGGSVISANAQFRETLHTPASSSEACVTGSFEDDANYHYVCTSTSHWRRVALSDF